MKRKISGAIFVVLSLAAFLTSAWAQDIPNATVFISSYNSNTITNMNIGASITFDNTTPFNAPPVNKTINLYTYTLTFKNITKNGSG
jgi:hypothetical protein